MLFRSFNPIAQETGRRAAPTLLAMGLIQRPATARPVATASTFPHRVIRGETLGNIAKKHAVTVQQILAVNGLLSNRIKPGQMIQIPGKGPAVRGRPGGATTGASKSNPSAKPGASGKGGAQAKPATPGKNGGKVPPVGKTAAPGKPPASGKTPGKAPSKGAQGRG